MKSLTLTLLISDEKVDHIETLLTDLCRVLTQQKKIFEYTIRHTQETRPAKRGPYSEGAE